MHVALDATPLTLRHGGIARYVRELAAALVREFPEDRVTLLSDRPFATPLDPPLPAGRAPQNWVQRRWWLYGVAREMRRLNADLLHGTHFSAPWLPLRPSVMTLHDLSPWLDAAAVPGAAFVRCRAPLLIGLGLATRIIAPSEAVRRQAIAYFRIHPSRIYAVPHAASGRFRPSPGQRAKPYFFCLSSAEPRKNLPMLIGAWREAYRQCGVELLLAGPKQASLGPVVPAPGLHLLGEVSEDELPGLYSGAVACLYPSLYEGFGLPVLEAMQCGALVIASSDPAISEVAAKAALLLDPRDALAWRQAMCGAAAGAEDLRALPPRALARAAEFSWARTARQTREVYAEAVAAFHE